MNGKKQHWFIRIVFGFSIAASFALTAYSIWLDRTGTATVAAAFTLALVLLQQLPVIESFEAFTLKVKMSNRIDQFDQLLGFLRRHASLSSKLTYIQLAFMDRMGSIGWSKKRDLLNDFDQLLRSMNVKADEIDSYKRPFLNLVSFDLFRVFENAAAHVSREQFAAGEKALQDYVGGRSIDPNDIHYNQLLAERNRFSFEITKFDAVLEDARLSEICPLMRSRLDGAALATKEKVALTTILSEVEALAQQCWTQGTVTLETESYLDRYGRRTNTRIDELLAAEAI